VARIYFVTAVAAFSMAADRSPANGHKVQITGPIVVHKDDVVQGLASRNSWSLFGDRYYSLKWMAAAKCA